MLQASTGSELPYFITHIYAWRNTESIANQERLITGGGEDSAKTLEIPESGHAKAKQLAQRVKDICDLDIIYSSDSMRALVVAKAVQQVFAEMNKKVEIIPAKQLREILHGRYELMKFEERNQISEALINHILDDEFARSEGPTTDPLLLWKIHPLTKRRSLEDCEPINVDRYNASGEQDPETIYELYKRSIEEFTRIALAHPNKKVGISTHGAILTTLIDAQDKKVEGLYRAPYYGNAIMRDGKKTVSAPTKVGNCDLLHFIYDSRTQELRYLQD